MHANHYVAQSTLAVSNVSSPLMHVGCPLALRVICDTAAVYLAVGGLDVELPSSSAAAQTRSARGSGYLWR